MKKSVQTAIVREVEEVTTGNSNGNFCVVKPALLQSYTCPFASQNLPFCQDSRQLSTKVLTHKLYRNKRYNTYIKANNLHPQSGNWPWSPTLFTNSSGFPSDLGRITTFRLHGGFYPIRGLLVLTQVGHESVMSYISCRSYHFPSDFVHLPAVLLAILFCIASLRLQQTDHQTARQSNDTDSKPIDRLVFKQVYSGTQYNIRRNILNVTIKKCCPVGSNTFLFGFKFYQSTIWTVARRS